MTAPTTFIPGDLTLEIRCGWADKHDPHLPTGDGADWHPLFHGGEELLTAIDRLLQASQTVLGGKVLTVTSQIGWVAQYRKGDAASKEWQDLARRWRDQEAAE